MAIPNVKTIVLRYRDLSSKNTIELHSDIINDKEFVWWGWWAKPQEKVAMEIFSKLSNRIVEEGSLELYLLDSGKIELRKAICTEISFDTSGGFKKSPQKNATPAYYRKSEYMIWFKLTEISEVIENADSEINKFSYLRIDEHFASGLSPFSAFENKKVYDLKELVEQQCTIWYLREAKTTDENRRIVSYAPGTGNADTCFTIDKTNKMLWLSDLHFSNGHHAFVKNEGSNNSLFNILKTKLDQIKFNKFSKVMVSGDFTFKSAEDEFEMARNFCNQLSSCYSIAGSSYIFCPGNHDMQYAKEEYKDEDSVVLNYEEAKENYINFYESTRETTANKFINTVQRFITSNGVMVEIIALNTCILQQDAKHFRGMGFAGNDQLSDLDKILKQTEKMNTVRILTMHHNLLPVQYAEKPQVNPMYSMLLDSEAITQFCLRNNISIVLHGHTHKDYYSEITRKTEKNKKTIYVIGLGSTGAKTDELTVGYNNQFATLTFEKNNLNIEIHEILPDGNVKSNTTPLQYSIPYGE